jgi:hypothetical protein
MPTTPAGVPAGGYTRLVASRYPRIQVPRDPELDAAISRARSALGPALPTSQIVRELALKGLEAVERGADCEQQAQSFLIDVANGRSPLDLASLRNVRDRAWR